MSRDVFFGAVDCCLVGIWFSKMARLPPLPVPDGLWLPTALSVVNLQRKDVMILVHPYSSWMILDIFEYLWIWVWINIY